MPSRGTPSSIGPLFALLCAAVALDAVGVGVLYPLLARIQTVDHLPTYGLGLMSGASFFAALLAGVGTVRLLDGDGARRVLLAALLVAAGSLLWFAVAHDLWSLVASRAVGGLAFGTMGPAALREASVGTSGQDRGRRLGMLSSAMMLGIVVGPLAGSLLAETGSLALPFEAVAAALVAVFVAFLVLSTRTGPAGGDEAVSGRGPSPATPVPAWQPVVAVLLLAASAQLPNGLYDALWSRLLTDRGASELLIGVSLSLFGLPFVVLAPFGGKLAERRGPLLATAVALLAADAFMASYGYVPSPVAITVLGVIEACAQAVAVPGGYAAVARTFSDDRAATGQGWASSAGTAAAGVAALAGAPVYAALGPGAVFAGGAAVSALLVAGSVGLGRGGPAARPASPAGTAPPGTAPPGTEGPGAGRPGAGGPGAGGPGAGFTTGALSPAAVRAEGPAGSGPAGSGPVVDRALVDGPGIDRLQAEPSQVGRPRQATAPPTPTPGHIGPADPGGRRGR